MSEEEINNLSEKVELRREIIKKDKEIKRLNKIITELEKTFKRDLEGILDFEEKHPEAILSRFPEYYLEQLQELKGSIK